MKKKLLLFFTLVCFSALSYAQIPTEGQIGLYNFDGLSFEDEIEPLFPMEDHDIGDFFATEDRFAVEEMAISFDGGAVFVSDMTAYNFTEAMSISVWIKVNLTPLGFGGLVNNWNDFEGGGYFLGLSPDNTVVWNVNLGNAINSEPLDIGNWFHVVATFEDEVAILYINGVEESTMTYAGQSLVSSPRALSVGAQSNLLDSKFIGDMDELIMYDRALTPEEVTSIFVNVPLGLDENSILNNSITVYPNPAENQIVVDNTNRTDAIESYVISDLTGKILFNNQLEANRTIDIAQLSQGVYTITFISESRKKASKKIIKM